MDSLSYAFLISSTLPVILIAFCGSKKPNPTKSDIKLKKDSQTSKSMPVIPPASEIGTAPTATTAPLTAETQTEAEKGGNQTPDGEEKRKKDSSKNDRKDDNDTKPEHKETPPPHAAGEGAPKKPEEIKPKQHEMNEKEKRIAQGKETRNKQDYPTMKDIESDWDSAKDKKKEEKSRLTEKTKKEAEEEADKKDEEKQDNKEGSKKTAKNI